uniref:TATA-box-binding protein 2-like n=1 Tax=Crassostrea virginica TaxID=6565 RepID=A0A8B8CQD2_CRAVI|nr:TATA-box-binding protein 2-like [Crassostrea virginica]
MQLTNVVVQARLNCDLDLRALANAMVNVRYDPTRFSGLIWQHRNIGGNCLLFANGKVNCNGKCDTIQQGVRRLRRYSRLLQRKGCHVTLSNVRVLTVSASHRLDGRVTLERNPYDFRYEPELFPAVMFTRKGIHFTLHLSGALLITGIKKSRDLENVVYPTVLELNVCL